MFSGTGTAIITPFNDDESIDYKSLEKIIEYQILNGVQALIVLGTTGEAPVISDEERNILVKFVVEKNNKRVKVIVGTGTNDPLHVVKHNENAEKFGADGLLIVNPYYNKGTQYSVFETFKFICAKTKLPVIVYNVPSRTGMNILPETVVKIAEACENVVAVKEASGNISQIAKLLAIKPKDLIVLSGNDDQTLPIIALGGSGVITAWGNAFPQEMVMIVNSMLEGKYEEALNYHNQYVENMQSIFIETSPIPIKYLVHKLGLCKNTFRLPLAKPQKNTMEILDEELEEYRNKNILLSKIEEK